MHATGIREAGHILSSSSNDHTISPISKRTTARMTSAVPQFHSFQIRSKRRDGYDKRSSFQDGEDVVAEILDSGFIECPHIIDASTTCGLRHLMRVVLGGVAG